MRRLVLLLVVLAAAQVGCSGEAYDTPSDGSRTDPANDPGSTGLLLTLQRSGGFAGTTETITIRSDGRAEVEGDTGPSGRLEIPPALLNRLEEELEELDWERAAAEPDNAVCSDCFEYDIRAGGQRVTTTAMGQSGEELGDLLALIEEILATSSGR